FGEKKLLDGSNGVAGTTTGENLEFVGATMATKDSRENGFEVKITQAATRAGVTGSTALTKEMVKAGEKLVVIEDGKMASYTSNADDSIDTTIQNLRSEIGKNKLNVDISVDEGGTINIQHREFGSGKSFQVSSSTAGVLSATPGEISTSEDGVDVKGTINGESAVGKGRILTGIQGAKCIEGLSVRYFGEGKNSFGDDDCTINDKNLAEIEKSAQMPEIPPDGIDVGRVFVSQNSMRFQVGGNLSNTVGLSLSDMKPTSFATDVENRSGIRSLADINVQTYEKAQDSLEIVDRAIGQISSERGRLGAIQKNSLETNLSNLRVANENLISSESVIRDTDMAKEMAVFTRNQIKTQSATAMLAQANQISEKVMHLLE
ncbi:flagellin, partial [bacterium]|nr:flagellin [bacterium]